MSTSATPRVWTATIEIGREVIDADLSFNDLKKEMIQTAVREAGAYIREGLASEAYVQIHKTTKAGTRRDECWSVYVDDRDGKVKAQR